MIHVIADVHWGSDYCNRKKFVKFLNSLDASDKLLILGDMLEVSSLYSKCDPWKTSPEEVVELTELLAPHAKKIKIFLSGNHEARLRKTFGISFSQIVANSLKVPFSDIPVMVEVDRIKVYCAHGYGGGRTEAGIFGNFREFYRNGGFAADFIVIGHHHRPVVACYKPNSAGAESQGKITWAACAPAWLEEPVYAVEKALMGAQTCGTIMLQKSKPPIFYFV